MRVAVAFTELRSAFIGMRVRGLVVAVRAVMRVPMTLETAIFVMRQCHALHGRDRRHALDRHNQGQQHYSKKPEESLRHQRAFYASCFEPDPRRRFPRTAHFLPAVDVSSETLQRSLSCPLATPLPPMPRPATMPSTGT
jgi:hypothetical protein